MNNVIACVFPDTLPDEELLFPLVQVFGQLVYMQAVEQEPLTKDLSTPFIEHLLQQKTLRLFTPVPLGEQRDRFLALMKDMKNRKDDYMSQLSMLTLAGLNRRGRMESKNTILSNLLQSGNIDSRKEEEELLLWQSRLMLKLGEFYDVEQTELNKALRELAGRQDALLAELREETDTPFSLTTGLQDANRKGDGILQHRLNAWSRLFFHDIAPIQPQIFVTRHQAAMDTLQEIFEKNHEQSALKIASLELPAEHEPDLLAPDQLLHQCPGLEAALTMLISLDAFSPSRVEEINKRFTECEGEWSHYLDARYPAGQFGRCTLDLFFFPEISARKLFLESFSRNQPSADDKSPTPGSKVLVGLMKKGYPA